MSLIHTIHDLEDHDFENEFIILKDFDPDLISITNFTLKYEYYGKHHSFGIFTNNKSYYMQLWKSNKRMFNWDELHLSITTSKGDVFLININEKNYGAIQAPPAVNANWSLCRIS